MAGLCYVSTMSKLDEARQAVTKLSPEELAQFRAWFKALEAERAAAAGEPQSTAGKIGKGLGRVAGQALSEWRKRGDTK